MAEYSALVQQTVNPGESITFIEAPVPSTRGLVLHRDDTGTFLLKGYVPHIASKCNNCPYCNKNKSAIYLVSFGANIAIPTGETVGEISVALAIDNSTVGDSIMRVTPAAVEEFFNVSRTINVPIWQGCCESVSVKNTSTIPILVSNANIIFARNDLVLSY